MPQQLTPLPALLRKEIEGAAELFTSLWPGYEEKGNTLSPHRQRTSVNKFAGYALFLGMPMTKDDPDARPFRTVKAWQKRVGSLRDLDVMREWVGKCLAVAGPIAEPAALAMDRNLTILRDATEAIVRVDARGLPGAEARIALQLLLADFGKRIALLEARPDTFQFREALAVVATPWSAALEVLKSNQDDVLLHSFRVRNKRLRFVLELLAQTAEDEEDRARFSNRAKIVNATHTALGELSDLHVLKHTLRTKRSNWGEKRFGLEESAKALEGARAALENDSLARWYDCWPKLVGEGFLGPILGSRCEEPLG